jgi:hypothetical protein
MQSTSGWDHMWHFLLPLGPSTCQVPRETHCCSSPRAVPLLLCGHLLCAHPCCSTPHLMLHSCCCYALSLAVQVLRRAAGGR